MTVIKMKRHSLYQQEIYCEKHFVGLISDGCSSLDSSPSFSPTSETVHYSPSFEAPEVSVAQKTKIYVTSCGSPKVFGAFRGCHICSTFSATNAFGMARSSMACWHWTVYKLLEIFMGIRCNILVFSRCAFQPFTTRFAYMTKRTCIVLLLFHWTLKNWQTVNRFPKGCSLYSCAASSSVGQFSLQFLKRFSFSLWYHLSQLAILPRQATCHPHLP